MRMIQIFGAVALVLVAYIDTAVGAESGGLRSLLERKYGKPKPSRRTRSAVPTRGVQPPSRQERTRDFYVITPGGKLKEVPARRDKDSRLETPSALGIRPVVSGDGTSPGHLLNIADRIKGWLAERNATAGIGTVLVAGAGETGLAASRAPAPYRVAQGTTTDSSQRKAVSPETEALPTIEKHIYVIQFELDVTGQQIDEFLQKYKLSVVKALPKLGIVYARYEGAPRASTRSLSPRARSLSPGEFSSLFAPRILRRMRQEPIVSAATVQSGFATKSLPLPSSTSVREQQTEYHWTWRPQDKNDGNWGLKRMRLPAVWHILDSLRSHGQTGPKTLMSFLDTGFGWHSHLKYTRIFGVDGTRPPRTLEATCTGSHGTHVAGIAGATHGLGRGIDGIVPDAIIEAVPIQADLLFVSLEENVGTQTAQRAVSFMDAVYDLLEFLEKYPLEKGQKRVVNISLGYNWHTAVTKFDHGDLVDDGLKTHVISQAKMLQRGLRDYKDNTLFVVAAGNDSQGLDTPLNTKWASPFAYLALSESVKLEKADNILVVEAVDRSGHRAPFSNTGGHVAAPGTEIMSTLSGRQDSYGVCPGTSQAAPHVTALAAILFEMLPNATPSQIAQIIRQSGVPDQTGGGAPRVDALEAVLRAKPDAIRILADLNGDGVVDAADIQTYRQHMAALTTVFQSTLGHFFFDLNGNGRVDDNEQWFPRIDLNGSGSADDKPEDRRCIGGRGASDLDVLFKAWGDKTKDFQSVVAENHLKWAPPQSPLAVSVGCKW